MVSLQKAQETLYQRVNDLLHDQPIGYAVETPREDGIEAVSSLLQRAEEDLSSAQERVKRLKWELEKLRSDSTFEEHRSR